MPCQYRHTKWPVILLALFCIHPPKPSFASEVQENFIFGVCIHLGQEHHKEYSSAMDVKGKIEYIGAQSTRDDLYWGVIGTKGAKTFPSPMRKIADGLRYIKARPLLILKGDRNIIPEGQPSTEASRAAYANYAKEAAISLKGINPIFEIWNEWNLGAWNNNKKPGSPENYLSLAQVTYPAIKEVYPDALILAGAVGDDHNWEWTKKAVQLGLMNYADGLSVHAYNHCSKTENRTGSEIMIRLKGLHKSLQEIIPSKEIPIYLTEFGWPTKDAECGGVTEDAAADNIAQFLLWAPAHSWLKGAWIYELNDGGNDPEDREHNFGLFRTDGTAKPSACSTRAAWSFISDYSFSSEDEPIEGVQTVVYKNSLRSERRAVWRKDAGNTNSYVKIRPIEKIYDPCNRLPDQDDGLFEIGQTPILIEMDKDTVIEFISK